MSGDKLGEAVYMTVGFIVLGVSFGQSSGRRRLLFSPMRAFR
ncbi:hypothetical protein [Paracoccus mutanolyticus]|nr:hypothetical protein [Paracoccus mutanolyticus]